MATAYTSPLLALASNDGYPPSSRPPFGRLLAISLTLHAGVLLMAETVRLIDFRDAPMVVQTVTLVTLPQERQATARPAAAPTRDRQPPAPRAPVKPVALPPKPAVAPPPEPVPRTAPEPDVIQEARVRSEALMQQALEKIKLPARPAPDETPPAASPPPPRPVVPVPHEAPPAPVPRALDPLGKTLDKIELPPDAPTFKRLSPAPTVSPRRTLPPPPTTSSAPPPSRQSVKRKAPSPELSRDINRVLKKLDLPDVPAVPAAPAPDRTVPVPKRKPRSSLSDNLKRELAVLEKLNRPKPVPAAPLPAPKPVPRRETTEVAKADPSASAALAPATSITMAGAGQGTNEYQALIQMLINKQWIAPPVDLSGRSLSVVVKFRIHRSGAISNVAVQDSSGNPYYDLAAKRAVLSADPLPPFPGTMSETYLDAHYTFSVKEPVS